jgi:DNA-directed RNA polymerase subunit RPC12/RpoP
MIGIVKVGAVTIQGKDDAEFQTKVIRKQMALSKRIQFEKEEDGFVFDVKCCEGASGAVSGVLTVFYKYSLDDVGTRHCAICREAHTLFYVNPAMNCTQCSFNAFRIRIQDREKVVKSVGRKTLEKL